MISTGVIASANTFENLVPVNPIVSSYSNSGFSISFTTALPDANNRMPITGLKYIFFNNGGNDLADIITFNGNGQVSYSRSINPYDYGYILLRNINDVGESGSTFLAWYGAFS